MIQEFCAENYTHIPAAIYHGANRIELCDNLAVGGTTPSTGVLEEVFHYTSEKEVPLMVMIRPRGGDFVYNDIELKIMHTDLIEAKKLGVDGIVLGCLTPNNWLDEDALELLLETAEGIEVTFHMAFDSIPFPRQFEAIDWLIAHGVSRILTHGGASSTLIAQNYDHLKECIAYAGDRLTFIIGGGVTTENKQEVVDTLGNVDVHGTHIVPISFD